MGGRRARGETFTFEWELSANYNNKASPGGVLPVTELITRQTNFKPHLLYTKLERRKRWASSLRTIVCFRAGKFGKSCNLSSQVWFICVRHERSFGIKQEEMSKFAFISSHASKAFFGCWIISHLPFTLASRGAHKKSGESRRAWRSFIEGSPP